MKTLMAFALFVSLSAMGAKARTVYLSETDMASIRVVPGRSTILSFPTKPNKVILGNQGMYAVEYVENDLAIAALRGQARGNLFVYMEGRRFAFDLSTTDAGGDEIILVRDAVEKPVRGKNGKGTLRDDAQVVEVRDDGEQEQWGRNGLFFREGGKWTLRTKAVGASAAVVFVALMIPPFFVEDNSASQGFAKSPLSADAPLQASTSDLEKYDVVKESRPIKGAGVNKANLRFTAPMLVSRPRNVNIPPGAMAEARLVSGASNGLVRAELTDSLHQHGETLLDEGTILVGQGTSNEERLTIAFSQAVFRDGTVATVQAQACDRSDQIVGLKGSKIGNKAINIAGSIGLGFIGGFSEGLQDTRGQQGVEVRPPSLRNALLNATATTALEQSKNLMSDLKDQKPVIEVPAGERICIIFGGAQ